MWGPESTEARGAVPVAPKLQPCRPILAPVFVGFRMAGRPSEVPMTGRIGLVPRHHLGTLKTGSQLFWQQIDKGY